jgi:hypothetical protein
MSDKILMRCEACLQAGGQSHYDIFLSLEKLKGKSLQE